jgi:hypothetical protein
VTHFCLWNQLALLSLFHGPAATKKAQPGGDMLLLSQTSRALHSQDFPTVRLRGQPLIAFDFDVA